MEPPLDKSVQSPAPRQETIAPNNPLNNSTLPILLLFLILVVSGNAFRLLPVERNLEFWTIWSPLLVPVWLTYWKKWDLFLWTKLFSLVPLSVVSITLFRLGLDPQIVRIGAFSLLSIDIVEAVVKDMVSARGKVNWSLLNALTGMLLIVLGLPSLYTIRVSDNKSHDFLWSLGLAWITSYTVWNLMFIYNNYPYAIGRHAAVLLAPFTLALQNGWDTWIESRGYTLALYALIRSTFYDHVRQRLDVDDPVKTQTQKRMIQVLAFVCNILLLVVLVKNKEWQRQSYHVADTDIEHESILREESMAGPPLEEWELQFTVLERLA